MAGNFSWSRESLSELRVGIHSPTGSRLGKNVRLQIFEVVVTAVFAKLRPDFDWWVTPSRPDGGVDFIGRGVFLTSKELGIDAAITIGGQCKKRGSVGSVVDQLSGSFVKMAETIHPTLFVAALSATVTAARIAKAKATLEKILQRHCHILDRRQLESLIGANLVAAEPIIQKALRRKDAALVLGYFERQAHSTSAIAIEVTAPSSVLAGESFRVRLKITRSSISENSFRLRWRPSSEKQAATLVVPVGSNLEQGVALDFLNTGGEDPFVVNQDLEFLIYAVGSQKLGTIEILQIDKHDELTSTKLLPLVEVVENLRPPFYDVPYREPLYELERGLARARAGRVSVVTVVGAGGAGKTRLCEEMCLEARRSGAQIVSARQAHSTEFPRRILANLLLSLADQPLLSQSTSKAIENLLSQLEPRLASRARSAIEALFEQAGKPGSFEDDQALLSVLAVLIARTARSQTVIIHLHDLHWCTFDVLELLDRLIWQLDQLRVHLAARGKPSGIRALFLLEGRMHEFREDAETGWSTKVFERFIERIGSPVATCRAFTSDESAAFAQRLFEQEHSANLLLPKALLALQQELINRVHQVAGGNPLHMLEQVKLLQQHGILAQNPRTGFIYMVKPEFEHIPLPATVFETIEARWRYYSDTKRSLAMLLWAAALVDDSLPLHLFKHLWTCIASDVSQSQIESTEFLRFPQSPEEGLQVSFRHENYFQTVRRIQLPDRDRRAIVEIYSAWFAQAKGLGPGLRYVQARVELEAPTPDLKRVNRILRAVRDTAVKRRDRGLTARVLATLLDGVAWPTNEIKPLSKPLLVQACDDEIALCLGLVSSGRTDTAYERIQRVLDIIEGRIQRDGQASEFVNDIKRRRFTLLTMKARILYHNRRPAEALAITEEAIRELELLTKASPPDKRQWSDVIMEVRHTHGVAIALVGDMKRAVEEAREAADIAKTLLKRSPQALEVIITYTNILLCEAPQDSESILTHYLALSEQIDFPAETLLRLNLNLAMARILLAYRQKLSTRKGNTGKLMSAHEILLGVFRQAHPLGRLSNAAAAALLQGIVSALQAKRDEIDWFAQAVALAIRARQLETLWRSHINLAHSLHRAGQSAHDSAAAALEIMVYSLSYYAEPDRNPRFNLLSVPMAHAVRYLILAQDTKAENVLRKFPALRRIFANVRSGELKDDRDGHTSHEWLRVGKADYVLY